MIPLDTPASTKELARLVVLIDDAVTAGALTGDAGAALITGLGDAPDRGRVLAALDDLRRQWLRFRQHPLLTGRAMAFKHELVAAPDADEPPSALAAGAPPSISTRHATPRTTGRTRTRASYRELGAFTVLLNDATNAGAMTEPDGLSLLATVEPDRKRLAAAVSDLTPHVERTRNAPLVARTRKLAAALALDDGPELERLLDEVLMEHGLRALAHVIHDSPGPVSPATLWAEHRDHLASAAAHALGMGYALPQILVLCVLFDAWPELVDPLRLTPGPTGAAVAAYESRPGIHVVARVAVLRSSALGLLSGLAPYVMPALGEAPPEGHVHVVVCGQRFGERFAAVYDLLPALGGVS